MLLSFAHPRRSGAYAADRKNQKIQY